jgi:hypothetical protein
MPPPPIEFVKCFLKNFSIFFKEFPHFPLNSRFFAQMFSVGV